MHNILRPTNMFITYECENNAQAYYVEVATIEKDGRPNPPRPMSYEEAYRFGSQLQNKAQRIAIGRVPKNLLFFNYTDGMFELVWYTPPEIQKMRFHESMKLPNGSAKMPGLIWSYRKRQLQIFAIVGNELSDRMRLYYAPFHNIYSNHVMCMGSATQHINFDTASVTSFMNSVVKSFFGSEFTQAHYETLDGIKLSAFWKKHLTDFVSDENAKKIIPFPEERLKATSLTLDQLFIDGHSDYNRHNFADLAQGADETGDDLEWNEDDDDPETDDDPE